MIETNLHRITVGRDYEDLYDLIREFSMQAHHERFNIKANGFFNINLNILGSVCYFINESKKKYRKAFLEKYNIDL